MNKKLTNNPSRFSRCIRAPFRALSRARDFYVNSLNGCAGRVHSGSVMGYPSGVVSGLPRSYSVQSRASSSGDEDLRELIRAASQGRMGSLNLGGARYYKDGVVPRSRSVAIGRIDEDEPCEFGDDLKVGSNVLYPRSRSCAVVTKRRVRVFA